MRVISGECKGRQLKSVPGQTTRPTTDKVKEAMFNRIGPFFEGGLGLDLYSGSGGLGIEALSRGIDKMIFIDRYSAAIDVIKTNLSLCRLNDRAEVFRNEVHRGIKAVAQRKLQFDLIFMDPPYRTKSIKNDIEAILKYDLLKLYGLLVIEHDEHVVLPDLWEGELYRNRMDTYNGRTAVSIYEKRMEKGDDNV